MAQKRNGLLHFVNAFKNSWNGLRAVARTEAAFRQELFFCVIGAIIIALVNITMTERVVLGVSLVCMLIAELINTAIETIVDRIGAEHHELSGRAKDIGSAIVLLTVITVICVWAFVLFF